MPWFFALTLFVSSGLLFLVQPMVGKMMLPLLGGSPAVWIGCLVFFQAGLLAGYVLAHAGPAWLGVRRHAALHTGLLLLPLLMLPMDLAKAVPPAQSFPVFWLWGVLLLSVGLPFVLAAASGPLLQRWFASTGHVRAGDPYFLYAASNLGSMLGLLSYPFVVEPNLDLDDQSWLWAGGYVLLVVLTAGAALWLWRSARETPRQLIATAERVKPPEPRPAGLAPTRWQRARWLALALVPSSLMLSVTLHITTDLAAMPLLWVVPMALYLGTYILAFTRWGQGWHRPMVRAMPLAVLVLLLMLLLEAADPMLVVVPLHLAGFFVIALMCHGELARTRPDVGQLTEFYLWLALGGVLGGLVNGLVAPLVLKSVVEYPLGLVAACFLRPAQTTKSSETAWNRLDWLGPILIGALTAGLIFVGQGLNVPPGPLSVAVFFALPLLVCYTFYERPYRFALGMSLILFASLAYPGLHGPPEYRVRSFFGVHRVTSDDDFRYLIHGNTIHGQQSLHPVEKSTPRTYYHPSGPIGQLLKILEGKGDPRLERVAIVGLGTGALACYAQENQHWTFFEIDPAVIAIAENPRLFTFLKLSRGRIDVVAGDARLSLERSPEKFGLIIIDAFTSDAIPVHLLTREALAIYQNRLVDNGLLVFHISNRYLHLEPILGNLAAEGPRPMKCLGADDQIKVEEIGKLASHWVLLTPPTEDTSKLQAMQTERNKTTVPLWQPVEPNPRYPIWTDQFSNLFGVLKW